MIKPQLDRLKESMVILKKLQKIGVSSEDLDYLELSSKFSDWVKMGPAFEGTVDFTRYGRKANITLPTEANSVAKCDFLVHKF
jgi:hypothetical protein